MIGPGLKLRYVLAVLAVGVLLTAAVAITAALSERTEAQHLHAVIEQLRASAPETRALLPPIEAELNALVSEAEGPDLFRIIIAGLLLTALAAWITATLITRIDRALSALMDSAMAIGRVNKPSVIEV